MGLRVDDNGTEMKPMPRIVILPVHAGGCGNRILYDNVAKFSNITTHKFPLRYPRQ